MAKIIAWSIIVVMGLLFSIELIAGAIITTPIAIYYAFKNKNSFLKEHQKLAATWGTKSGKIKAEFFKR